MGKQKKIFVAWVYETAQPMVALPASSTYTHIPTWGKGGG